MEMKGEGSVRVNFLEGGSCDGERGKEREVAGPQAWALGTSGGCGHLWMEDLVTQLNTTAQPLDTHPHPHSHTHTQTHTLLIRSVHNSQRTHILLNTPLQTHKYYFMLIFDNKSNLIYK